MINRVKGSVPVYMPYSTLTVHPYKDASSVATDAELIGRVRNGDHPAFRHLVARYESRVAATVIDGNAGGSFFDGPLYPPGGDNDPMVRQHPALPF